MPVMPQLIIKDKQIIRNSWHLLDSSAGIDVLADLDGCDVLVPLCCWQAEQPHITARTGRTGVWLDSHERASALVSDALPPVDTIPLIALNFPMFSDGRNYSTARFLRQQLNYSEDLMAIGDVLRDQVFYMTRCGINVLALREDQSPEDALSAFTDFRDVYQGAPDQPLPLFRRR